MGSSPLTPEVPGAVLAGAFPLGKRRACRRMALSTWSSLSSGVGTGGYSTRLPFPLLRGCQVSDLPHIHCTSHATSGFEAELCLFLPPPLEKSQLSPAQSSLPAQSEPPSPLRGCSWGLCPHPTSPHAGHPRVEVPPLLGSNAAPRVDGFCRLLLPCSIEPSMGHHTQLLLTRLHLPAPSASYAHPLP